MRKDRPLPAGRWARLLQRLQLSKRLTPQERQALWLVVSLFLLGLLVRGYRLAQGE